jgi:16S rRNA (cytidine1402-2'-O)-methyltransferase
MDPSASTLLSEHCLLEGTVLLVEEHKSARRLWLKAGLPREAIEKFVLYNEHNQQTDITALIKLLRSGKNIFLLSDCGLPAFCDPGQKLVKACHENKIKVTATAFANSIALAIALSGIEHGRFIFEGFLPANSQERSEKIGQLKRQVDVTVLMDTPYRMHKLIEELAAEMPERLAFLGVSLNASDEELIYGKLNDVLKRIPVDKKEFILILDKQGGK